MMVETLRSLVTDMRSIAPFPHVASTVLSLAAKPGVVPEQLIEVIQTDPGLTGKVLKLCNSAYYGFQREIASLEEAGNMVGVRTLTNLVLTSCSGRVVVTGMGKSGLIAQKIAATFSSTGLPSYFMHPAEALHGDLGMLVSGDVLLALSNSGETSEIVRLLEGEDAQAS